MYNLDKLLGKPLGFYGVDGNIFKIGRYILETIENPDDGYRSFLECVELVQPSSELVLFDRPIAKVCLSKIEINNGFDGYYLVDVQDKHIWLRFGTDRVDDYYPCFVFSYMPKVKKRVHQGTSFAYSHKS